MRKSGILAFGVKRTAAHPRGVRLALAAAGTGLVVALAPAAPMAAGPTTAAPRSPATAGPTTAAAPRRPATAATAVDRAAGSCPMPQAGAELRLTPNRAFKLRERLQAGTVGARTRLRGLPVIDISSRAVVDRVLGGNLTVLSSAETVAIARALVVQSDAVFDPTLFSSLSYTNRFNQRRHDVIGRLRDQDASGRLQADALERQRQAVEGGSDSTADSTGAGNCLPGITVDGTVVPASSSCQVPPAFSVQEEFASFDTRSDHRVTGSLGAGVNFAFGGSLNASLSSTWHKPISMASGAPALTDPAYESGLAYDPYGWNTKLFWTSQASLSLSLPLPYTKGFGYEGSASYYAYQLTQSSERRAGWSDRSARNATLSQALQAYWDAALAVQTLRAVLDLRETLGERLGTQERRLTLGVVTRYAIAQLQSEELALDEREEAAWGALLTASNRLGRLLARDQHALVLPGDAEALLRSMPTINQAGAYDRALASHPDIKAQESTYDASKLTLSFRENQDLPDLSLSASFSVGQTDAVYGYASFSDSIRHLASPDTSTFFIGLRYHLPIGMNATEAALSRARIEERQADQGIRQARQRVVNAVDRAVGDVRSSEAQVRQGEENVRLAECAYDLARGQEELGFVGEFEVLNKYRDLVNARLGVIAARISQRKAHIALLAAQGTLEQDYGR